jgi:hypothetical protein
MWGIVSLVSQEYKSQDITRFSCVESLYVFLAFSFKPVLYEAIERGQQGPKKKKKKKKPLKKILVWGREKAVPSSPHMGIWKISDC